MVAFEEELVECAVNAMNEVFGAKFNEQMQLDNNKLTKQQIPYHLFLVSLVFSH